MAYKFKPGDIVKRKNDETIMMVFEERQEDKYLCRLFIAHSENSVVVEEEEIEKLDPIPNDYVFKIDDWVQHRIPSDRNTDSFSPGKVIQIESDNLTFILQNQISKTSNKLYKLYYEKIENQTMIVTYPFSDSSF